MNSSRLFKLIQALCLSAVFTLSLTACESDDYNTLPAPALGQGECEYKKQNFTANQTIAQTEMDRVAAIFEDSTIGSYAVAVLKKEVYLSQTVNGQPHRYGFQIVFSCDKASIHFEESGIYSTNSEALAELDSKWNMLLQGRYIKPITKGTYEYSWETCDTCTDYVCDTCYDEDGYSYDCNCGDVTYDCNCTSGYDYTYWVEYMLTHPPTQGGTSNGNGPAGRYAADGSAALSGHQQFVKSEIEKILSRASNKQKPADKRDTCAFRKGKGGVKIPNLTPSKHVKNSSVVPNKKSLYYILKAKD